MSAAVGELTERGAAHDRGRPVRFARASSARDELSELGHALDRLAGSLATTLGELRAERDLQRPHPRGDARGRRRGRSGRAHRAREPGASRRRFCSGPTRSASCSSRPCGTRSSITLVDGRASRRTTPVEIELPGPQAAPAARAGRAALGRRRGAAPRLRRRDRSCAGSSRCVAISSPTHRTSFAPRSPRCARPPRRCSRARSKTRVAASRFLDIIERNAQRLQSLVEDMLELSKLESNEFKLKRERVELQRVVPIVLALFRERAEKKGVRLGAELRAEPPAPSKAIPRALEHVLSNLVDNAVKYCPSGTRILVSATERRLARQPRGLATTGPGSPPSTCRACSSASIASTPVVRASSAEPASVCRSSSTWSTRCEARSRSRAPSVRGATFTVSLRRSDGAAFVMGKAESS